MKYLSIDTTTKVTALALAEDSKVIAEGFLHTNKTHSERLIPMLDQLLLAASWKLSDLDFIGVVRGPGSFTGIRIGIATAEGFAQVLNIPVIGVTSLEALAWAGYGRDEEIVPILDARKNEWYTARFRWSPEDQLECLTQPCAKTHESWLEELKRLDRTVLFVGDAVPHYKDKIIKFLGARARILPDYLSLPRGAYVSCEVWRQWSEKGFSGTVEPYYIRLSEAEVNYAKKEAEDRK
ncbi:MAG: tRNA (adenosine(37)-N6)-threonylcarbamoyltransferase complex dimerization subunit type 1 TsaB [Desulfitobacterium hafniense]|nr:tRNA (adenosine(37)-N6)-threonylcarbamoyltransferase complex dimerization subunit type 1 TsaB [Desulfitobacterium hafniense]